MSATNRGAERREADFYATPLASFERILVFLPADSKFYDPCCGDGRLIIRMQHAGLHAKGADIRPAAPGFPVKDYLLDATPRDFVISNPPFSLAREFVEHALKHSREVMFLLRLNFLGAQRRQEFWRRHEPCALFVLSDRPDFTGGGGDATEYAWFYWGRRFSGIKHP